MLKPDIWTWWTHRTYGMRMQVTQVRDLPNFGYVNLWDKPMLIRWKGSLSQFRRWFVPSRRKQCTKEA